MSVFVEGPIQSTLDEWGPHLLKAEWDQCEAVDRAKYGRVIVLLIFDEPIDASYLETVRLIAEGPDGPRTEAVQVYSVNESILHKAVPYLAESAAMTTGETESELFDVLKSRFGDEYDRWADVTVLRGRALGGMVDKMDPSYRP